MKQIIVRTAVDHESISAHTGSDIPRSRLLVLHLSYYSMNTS